ncbi:MAG: hypothetical protein RX318_08180 [bacterium]|nr:hypothetical protein [bacterium]
MDGKKIELKIEELEERIAPGFLGGGHSRVEFTNSTFAILDNPGGSPIPGLFGLRVAHGAGGLKI